MTTEEKRRELKCWARLLRKHFPAPLPVTVRLRPRSQMKLEAGEADGSCRLNDTCTRFRIDVSAAAMDPIDTLCHEWAHALAWKEWVRHEHHGPRWGAQYARITRWNGGEGEFKRGR